MAFRRIIYTLWKIYLTLEEFIAESYDEPRRYEI
jgi:hypothetical protein